MNYPTYILLIINMAKYRIEWTSLSINYKGNGDWFESKKLLELWVIEMNKQYRGVIHHWISTK